MSVTVVELVAVPDGRVFSVARKFRTIAIVCFLFWLPATVLGVWVALANADGSFRNPRTAAIFFGCFGGVNLLGSLYLWRAYRIGRLTLSATHLQLKTVFRTRTLLISDISRAKWRVYPGVGHVVLHTPARRMVIEMGDYAHADELRVICRSLIPEAMQENYAQFEAARTAVRRPVVVGASTTFWLAVVSLLIATACWAGSGYRTVRALVAMFSQFFLALALLATYDSIRRPTTVSILAAIIAWLATLIVGSIAFAVIRQIIGFVGGTVI